MRHLIKSQPKWLVLLEALGLVGLIGVLDHVTGWEWSFLVPYAVPIVLVTWKLNLPTGFSFAFLCALTYWIADRESNPFHGSWGYALTAAAAWFYFSALVVAVRRVADQRESNRVYIKTLERTQQLEQEIIEIADQEKERLGRELHDGLCQTLAGISALSATLSRQVKGGDHCAALETAEEICQSLKTAIRGTRELARGLDPLGLDEIGLHGALSALTNSVQNLFKISCSFEYDRSLPRLNHTTEMHLFRVAQEALSNALTHSQTDRVEICLTAQDKQGRLSVRDEGVGLQVKPANPQGIGLRTMAYRARMIGASFSVQENERGVEVVCVFPIAPQGEPKLNINKNHVHPET